MSADRGKRVSLAGARDGMTLVEVLVTMIMLAVALSSVARVSVLVSSIGRSNEVVAQRSAALQQLSAWLGGIPFTRIDSVGTANKTITAGTFSYTRRIVITTPETGRRTITIVVTPTADSTKADSVVFDRAAPAANPFCTGC